MRFAVLFVLVPVLAAGAFSSLPTNHYDMGPTHRFTPEAGDESGRVTFSNGFEIDTRRGFEPRLPAGLTVEPGDGARYHIIQFTGPLEQRWLRRLHARGVEPFGYLPHYAVLAKLTAAEADEVRAMDAVNWVGLFQPAYKLEAGLLDASGRGTVVALLMPGEKPAALEDLVRAEGGDIVDVMTTRFGITVTLTVDGGALDDIARLDEVAWVQAWSEPEIANSDAQWVTQTGWRSTAPAPTDTAARRIWTRGVRGQGIVLSTTDTGLNHGHDMFRDPSLSITPPGIWPAHRKIVAFKTYQGASPGESPRHGTHVNGTVAGDDSVTGGTSYYDGMSFKGRLYFVDLTSSSGGFVIGSDLTALWDTVYLGRGLPDSLRPIEQHSGSWRWYNSSGTYLLMDASTDAYCWEHKDFLNLIAAGNESSARRIGNPAIAKDVLTIGATGNGTSSNTIASFSSRGPTQDNRIKPTVCAPGVRLWSPRMAPATNTYEQLSGTSMATPATNGALGLVRCYLREGYYPTGAPVAGDRIGYISSALMRSMAVVSADPNIGSYVPPSFNMGWGRVDDDSVLYFTGDSRKLILLDDTSGVATGEYKEHRFRVTTAIPLRIAMAWTDTAAAPNANPTLVNDVNLEVIAPSGTYYRGNQYSAGQSVANPSSWDNNNVEECVRVNSPELGVWTIRVRGQNVRSARQPFAWSITGGVDSSIPDVGVTVVRAPTGTVDLGASVTPACSVFNYGTSTATYDVRMHIGGAYTNNATVAAHAPQTARYVTFPSWTAGPAGWSPVRCTTRLSGDAFTANDRELDSVFVRFRDVGCRTLLAPSGTVDSGVVVTPSCSVYNYGNTVESYQVRMSIGAFYNSNATVNTHAPGTWRYVTFSNWTATQRGTHVVRCSTRFTADMLNSNDRQTGSVTVRVADVAARVIETPSGTVDSGAVVTPACSLYNHGTTTASYDARMRIGGFYNSTATVAGHPPATWRRVTFPNWTAVQLGAHAVSCSTELGGDLVNANDKVTGTVLVQALDVGVTGITAPVGLLLRGQPFTPVATWENYGNTAVDFEAWMLFDNPSSSRVYAEKVDVAGLAAGADTAVGFPGYSPLASGGWSVRCSTRLDGDANAANDLLDGGFDVGLPDASTEEIVAPTGGVDTGEVVIPTGRIANRGDIALDIRAWLALGDPTDAEVYRESLDVVSVPPNTDTVVAFPSFNIGIVEGQWTARCSVATPVDVTPANDFKDGTFTVSSRPVWPTGWHEVASMPSAPSGKGIKRGAWLAYHGASEYVYGAKGYKTNDFYVYNPFANNWQILSGMPYTTHPLWLKKPPRKGSKGATDGERYQYVTQGNNSLGFWRYDVANDSWAILEDVPLGPNRKKVKGGTDLVYYHGEDGPDYVYMLKGYRTEFYRYDVAAGTWEQLEDAPTGARNKYDKGSWIVMDDAQRYIYASKAKYNELWAYDIDSMAWLPQQLDGMPLIGNSGRRKKSKDGGSGAWYDRRIFALKGGNTGEFWCYFVDGDTWVQLEDMPLMGSTGKNKKVKHGADIASWGYGAFFALKGNKTLEFWRYVLPYAAGPRPARDGIAGASVPLRHGLVLQPNPLSGRALTVRYALPMAGPASISVFDVAGRSVAGRRFVATRTGAVQLDLADLSAGVYLLRLEAGETAVARKLVIQD